MQFAPNSHLSLNFNLEGAPEENRSKKTNATDYEMQPSLCGEKVPLGNERNSGGIVRRRTTNHKHSLVLPSSATL